MAAAASQLGSTEAARPWWQRQRGNGGGDSAVAVVAAWQQGGGGGQRGSRVVAIHRVLTKTHRQRDVFRNAGLKNEMSSKT